LTDLRACPKVVSVEVMVTETKWFRRPLAMDTTENLKGAIALLPKGKWYSPDTTVKKSTWFVSVAHGQAVGMPKVGDKVWVAKSRDAYQLVELTTEQGEHTDKEGLRRALFTAKVLSL
jgi:hypothetical protein